jgi:tRNA-dihydrouridine synthase 3
VGGNLPFRRLAVEFGAQVTVGEMAAANKLLRRESSELALLRSHPDEPLFGAQLAARKPEALAEAGRIAEACGARFVDLNCGCPIRAITQRGLGASLLRKPGRLGRLVTALREAVKVPVTVKLRTGWSAEKPNVSELAKACEEAGASAIAIHGRSREQRYGKAADWDLIGRVAAERTVPVIGNGDILTHYEAAERMRRSGVSSVMLGRGALTKPWLFREIKENRGWFPSAEQRLGVVYRLVELLREHFRDDERGRKRSHRFLSWHMDFFWRYRPLPEAEFGEPSLRHPLIHTRMPAGSDLPPLEALLRDPRPETHELLSRELIGSQSLEEATIRARALADRLPPPDAALESEIDPRLVAG